MSEYYVRAVAARGRRIYYDIGYRGTLDGTLVIYRFGAREYFDAQGHEIERQPDWQAAVDEWHAWNPGHVRFDESGVQ